MRRITRRIYRYIIEPHVTQETPNMEQATQTCETCQKAWQILWHLYYGVVGEIAMTANCRMDISRTKRIDNLWNPPNAVTDKARDEIIIHTRVPGGCVSPSTWTLTGWYWKDNDENHRRCAATLVEATLYQPDDTADELKQLNLLILKHLWRYARNLRHHGMAWMLRSRFRWPDAKHTKLLVAIGPHSPSPSAAPHTAI